MIRRFYVHNFRCLENFELPVSGQSSLLLIGKNGAGKSTVGAALEILQKIARGTNRVGDLVRPKDLTLDRTEVPMRFEIEIELNKANYSYSLALEFPDGFKELRVSEEILKFDGKVVLNRKIHQVSLAKTGKDSEANFLIDWHLVALPIIQQQGRVDPILTFKKWLANSLILRPIPSLASGNSDSESIQPNPQVTNFGEWFTGLLASAPAAYSKIDHFLKQVMPDLQDIKNPNIGGESRRLSLQFSGSHATTSLLFDDLSDGEKSFMIFALVIAANGTNGPLLCFWDEPDNFLAPPEIGSAIMALRRAFLNNGQLIITSHNPEVIRRFSDENILVLLRRTHLEPTIVQSLHAMRQRGEIEGSFVDMLIRGDLTDGR